MIEQEPIYEDYIYDVQNLQHMLSDDEISPEEQGFMQGYIEAART